MIRIVRHVLLLCVVALLFLPGCATLSESSRERSHRLSQVSRRDRLALTEDIDFITLSDRSSRLTRWHDR